MKTLNLILLIFLAGTATCLPNFKRGLRNDPEETMTAPEIARYWGYPCEVHHVTTKDGYINEMHRIPHGSNSNVKAKNGPILLHHGLMGSSADWVMNVGLENLAFILADAGYDVWLGNARGNRYSRAHTSLNPDTDKAFWNFSWDEMALIDQPACIDYILDQTGSEKIPFVGLSMGTTIMFSLLSESAEYNEKISGFFALAPVAHLEHLVNPLLTPLVALMPEEEILFKLLGDGELTINQYLIDFFADTVCRTYPKAICENIFFAIGGYDADQMNATRVPVYTAHFPAGSSVNTFMHYLQLGDSKKYQKFDYGAEENIKIYGRMTPPEYDLTKITAPVYLFWADNDVLADKEDVAKAASELKSLKSSYRVPYDAFSHIDFQLALDVKKLVYDELVELLTILPK